MKTLGDLVYVKSSTLPLAVIIGITRYIWGEKKYMLQFTQDGQPHDQWFDESRLNFISKPKGDECDDN